MTEQRWWDGPEVLNDALWAMTMENEDRLDRYSVDEWDACANLATSRVSVEQREEAASDVQMALEWFDNLVVWAHQLLNDPDVRAVLERKERVES